VAPAGAIFFALRQLFLLANARQSRIEAEAFTTKDTKDTKGKRRKAKVGKFVLDALGDAGSTMPTARIDFVFC
jgi:hypothetical protein